MSQDETEYLLSTEANANELRESIAQLSDGGPAFPCLKSDVVELTKGSEGMSLRDWFAGQALAGHMATGLFPNASQKNYPGQTTAQWAAENAYVYADAMIAQREKEQE